MSARRLGTARIGPCIMAHERRRPLDGEPHGAADLHALSGELGAPSARGQHAAKSVRQGRDDAGRDDDPCTRRSDEVARAADGVGDDGRASEQQRLVDDEAPGFEAAREAQGRRRRGRRGRGRASGTPPGAWTRSTGRPLATVGPGRPARARPGARRGPPRGGGATASTSSWIALLRSQASHVEDKLSRSRDARGPGGTATPASGPRRSASARSVWRVRRHPLDDDGRPRTDGRAQVLGLRRAARAATRACDGRGGAGSTVRNARTPAPGARRRGCRSRSTSGRRPEPRGDEQDRRRRGCRPTHRRGVRRTSTAQEIERGATRPSGGAVEDVLRAIRRVVAPRLRGVDRGPGATQPDGPVASISSLLSRHVRRRLVVEGEPEGGTRRSHSRFGGGSASRAGPARRRPSRGAARRRAARPTAACRLGASSRRRSIARPTLADRRDRRGARDSVVDEGRRAPRSAIATGGTPSAIASRYAMPARLGRARQDEGGRALDTLAGPRREAAPRGTGRAPRGRARRACATRSPARRDRPPRRRRAPADVHVARAGECVERQVDALALGEVRDADETWFTRSRGRGLAGRARRGRSS